jgi:hypothetical protein
MPDWACPACGLSPATEAERTRHEQGIDDKHLECAHQDIDAIKAEQKGRERRAIFGRAWA